LLATRCAFIPELLPVGFALVLVHTAVFK
jgi:hypothetical protein